MTRIHQPFTVGTWVAKAGSERDLIAEWDAFAKWTAKNQPGAGVGYLLQDPAQPQHFISFGPWENAEAIRAWREHPQFQAFAAKVRDLCVEFQPQSFVLVASSEQ